MRTVWTFPLHGLQSQTIDAPCGARFLTAQVQANSICLWAEVDDKRELHEVRVFIVATGGYKREDARHYIGTVQLGDYVWHVYVGEVLP
jgi:hypothetical protein